CARPGKLQSTVQQIWLPLFSTPPLPTYIAKDEFMAKMKKATEQRFNDVAAAVQKLRARGGKIVFVRFPHSGELKKLEDRITPRTGIWDRVIKDTAGARNLLRRFSRAVRIQLSRMVASLCRRLG